MLDEGKHGEDVYEHSSTSFIQGTSVASSFEQ